MRLLSITAQKPHSTGSGVYLTELVRGFDRLGHSQGVVAGILREDSVSFPPGVAFFPVFYQTKELPFPVAGMSDEMPYPSTRYRDLTPEMVRQFREAFEKAVRQAMETVRPDVILCHHLYLLTSVVRELAPLQRESPSSPPVRVEGICHGSDLRQFKKNPLLRSQIRAGIQSLDTVWCLHREQREDIIRTFGCDPSRVHVLGTGYNSQIFKKRADSRACFSPSSQIRIIFAGKLSEKKGVVSLLKALSCLPQDISSRLSVTLAGGWGNKEEYERILWLSRPENGCPCPVVLTGRLSQEELSEAMNRSDLFVLPSFYEGLPLVLLEAMACGLKLICTDLPGIRPWMDEAVPGHGICFLAPPAMIHEDEPVPEALPAFEMRLAQAIADTVSSLDSDACAQTDREQEKKREACLSALSWDGLCEKILADEAR